MTKLDAFEWSIRLAIKIAAGFVWMCLLRAYTKVVSGILSYARKRASGR